MGVRARIPLKDRSAKKTSTSASRKALSVIKLHYRKSDSHTSLRPLLSAQLRILLALSSISFPASGDHRGTLPSLQVGSL
jgi:hypothetical protein